MRQVSIENPILNSPFAESSRHCRFFENGIPDEIVGSRRTRSYFIPIRLPILAPYDQTSSTRQVDFGTSCPTWQTREEKSHVNYVVADTESWKQKFAHTLVEMGEVIGYVKNHNLGFTIPYTLNDEEHNYIPNFIVRIDDGHGPDDPLNLIIEVTGEKRKDKEAKVAMTRTLWVPAINKVGLC